MAMATAQTEPQGSQNISSLLDAITGCLTSTGTSLPKTHRDDPADVSIEPPADGISLLDVKSDLLLSYIHNLVFLTIIQLRELSSGQDGNDAEQRQSQQEDLVKKLVELRVYLDRGVRPLEGRLKYQVDKVVKAAEDSERAEREAQASAKRRGSGDDGESGSDSQSESDSDDNEEEENLDDMAYRPNLSVFAKNVEPPPTLDRSNTNATGDGIYRPPKIMPTALPTTETKERKERVNRRSNVIDEFVSAEMSSAPMAEPSVGSTIVRGGRHTKSQKERRKEAERAAYEETNFIRLGKESKKDRAKTRGQRGPEGTFGGEDWRGLTEGADRIAKLTRRAQGSGGALDRSRKRKNDDGPRGDAGLGHVFEKRRKKIEGWKK